MRFEHFGGVVQRPFEWTEERIATREAAHWHLTRIAILYFLVDVINFGLMWTPSFVDHKRKEYEYATEGGGSMLDIIMKNGVELTFIVSLGIELVLLAVHVGFMCYGSSKATGNSQTRDELLRVRVLEAMQFLWIAISIARSLAPLEQDPAQRAYWYFWMSQVLVSFCSISLFVLFNCFNPLVMNPKMLWTFGALLCVVAFRFHIRNENVIIVLLVVSYVINVVYIGWHCKECFNIEWANIMSPREVSTIVTFTTCATVSGLIMLVMFNDVFGTSSSQARIILYLALSTLILVLAIVVPRYLQWAESRKTTRGDSTGNVQNIWMTDRLGSSVRTKDHQDLELLQQQQRHSLLDKAEQACVSMNDDNIGVASYPSNTHISVSVASSELMCATSTVMSSDVASSDVASNHDTISEDNFIDDAQMDLNES